MAQRAQRLVHPVGLPTLLPTGQVRLALLAAREALGLPHQVPGDLDILPGRYAFRAITTPERFKVIGHVVYDEQARELAFNTVEGFHGLTREGLPMIMKLERGLYYNATSGQVAEFNLDRSEVTLHVATSIKGVAATRLYRMLQHLTIQDAKRWNKVFPPDPVAKGVG